MPSSLSDTLKTSSLLSSYIESIPWIPQEGPQRHALLSKADVLLYGGAAGGGKSSLACGLAITRHERTLIMRREATQMKGILNEIAKIVDPARDGYNGQRNEWRVPAWDGVERTIYLGSCPHPGDESKWQGIERDLLVLDECANFTKESVLFLMGWTRTTTIHADGTRQRTRVLLCSNPPATSDGYWLTEMFAPWLDPKHVNPATPGELRWFTTIEGKMTEVANGNPIPNPHPVSDDDKWYYPKSMTYIPARVSDNKYLDSEYLRELQALPEPLRSMFLLGDFSSGREDDSYQVIPSDWVRKAQARWQERPLVADRVTSVGIDPSRGGRDATVVAMREGWHFHALRKFEGAQMTSGNDVANEVLKLVAQSHAPLHVDVIGIGASVVDSLTMYVPRRVVPVNAASKGEGMDNSGTLKFANKRAELWWGMRDLLDPSYGQKVSLPPDQALFAELCSPRYRLTPSGIQVERKDDIIKRLGRSTDSADAVIMAAIRSAPMNIQGVRPRVQVIGGINN